MEVVAARVLVPSAFCVRKGVACPTFAFGGGCETSWAIELAGPLKPDVPVAPGGGVFDPEDCCCCMPGGQPEMFGVGPGAAAAVPDICETMDANWSILCVISNICSR